MEVEEKKELEKEKKPILDVVKKKTGNISKKTKIGMGIGLGVIAIVLVLIAVLSKITSPEEIALRYFKASMDVDYDTAYQLVNFPESEFITKELYASSMKNYNDTKKELEYYKVVDPNNISLEEYLKNNLGDEFDEYMEEYGSDFYDEVIDSWKKSFVDNENRKTILIEYKEKWKTPVEYFQILVQKTEENSYLFFPKWAISSDDTVLDNYELNVPVGSKVTYAGVEVSDKYLDKDSEKLEYDTYKLPYVMLTTTDLTITLGENFIIEEEVYPFSSGYYPDYVSLKQEAFDTTKDSLKNALTDFMTSAFNKTPYEEYTFGDFWKYYEDDYYSLEKIYQNIVSGSTSSYYTYENFKITGLDMDNSFSMNDEGLFTVDVDINYSYNEKYTSFTGIERSTSQIDSYTVEVEYKVEDGNFVVYSFDRTFAYLF